MKSCSMLELKRCSIVGFRASLSSFDKDLSSSSSSNGSKPARLIMGPVPCWLFGVKLS